MSSLYHSQYFVMFFLVIHLHWSVSPQLTLHLTYWPDDDDDDSRDDAVFQHNCLLVNHWENEDDIDEITPYCLSEWPSKWNIQKNSLDQKYSFAQLFAHKITSEQLYLWSVPLDIVENYQFYLEQVFTLNDTFLAEMQFWNCTGQSFGPRCQYSFDPENAYSSSSSSLGQKITEFHLKIRQIQLTQTCYRHTQCNLGLTSLCIQWSDVCDGFVHCMNGTDEEHCWQLEINECNENEFPCRNGLCIPWSFLTDTSYSYDCLDGSDKFLEYRNINPTIVGPLYKLEGVFCGKLFQNNPTDRLECQYECFDHQNNAPNERFFFLDKPETLTGECWSALGCYLKII